jgi:hypothetical protein
VRTEFVRAARCLHFAGPASEIRMARRAERQGALPPPG